MRHGDKELGNHNNVGRRHKIEAIADDLWGGTNTNPNKPTRNMSKNISGSKNSTYYSMQKVSLSPPPAQWSKFSGTLDRR